METYLEGRRLRDEAAGDSVVVTLPESISGAMRDLIIEELRWLCREWWWSKERKAGVMCGIQCARMRGEGVIKRVIT